MKESRFQKLYSVDEVLAAWPEEARPVEKRLRRLARRFGCCRIEGRSMAFTDDDIRAIVEMAKYSDARSTEFMISTLVERRNRIGRTFFSKILPLDHFRLENGNLQFDDLAVLYGFQPPRQYGIQWFSFINTDQKHELIPGAMSTQLPAEAVRSPYGSYFCAVINALGSPLKPVSIYIRKEENDFRVVGIERPW